MMSTEKILSILLNKKINFWELIKNQYFIKDIVSTIKLLQKNGYIGILNSEIFITDSGIKFAKKLNLNPEAITDNYSNLFPIDNLFIKKLNKYRKKFPLSDDFDQQLLTDEAIFIKLNIMLQKGDLHNKEIVCIGDDDMFAIALALTGLPKKITVLDIDDRIIDYENKVLEKLGFKNACIKTDLLKPLSSDLIGKYDVFECEPPDNPKGHELFISRGVTLLKNEGGIGYTGICDQTLSKIERTQIVNNIKKMNGTITDVWEHCKIYETVGDEENWVLNLPKEVKLPTFPWFNSNLMRLKFEKNKIPSITKSADISYVTELSKIIC